MRNAAFIGTNQGIQAQIPNLLRRCVPGDPFLQVVDPGSQRMTQGLFPRQPVLVPAGGNLQQVIQGFLCLFQAFPGSTQAPQGGLQTRIPAEPTAELLRIQGSQAVGTVPGFLCQGRKSRPVRFFPAIEISQTVAQLRKQLFCGGLLRLVLRKGPEILAHRIFIHRASGVQSQALGQLILSKGLGQGPLALGLVPPGQKGRAILGEEALPPPGKQVLPSLPGGQGMGAEGLHPLHIPVQRLRLGPGSGHRQPEAHLPGHSTEPFQLFPAPGLRQGQGTGQGLCAGFRFGKGPFIIPYGLGQQKPKPLGILAAPNSGKRMILGMAGLPARRHQPGNSVPPGGQLLGRHGSKVPRKGPDVRGLTVLLIPVHQVKQGHTAGQGPMQRLGVAVQIPAKTCNAFRLGSICLRGFGPGHLRGLLKLLQHILFLGTVGVKLQAEGANADGVQTPLNHLQSRHFLRHEQHRLALGQSVGDQGRNGLGFSRSRRAMEHEAPALGGSLNGIKLGSIGGNGQIGSILRYSIADDHFLRRPGKLSLHQTADDLIFRKILGAIPNIVPHDELREGENPEVAGFQHVPPALAHDGLTQDGEHLSHIDAVFVLGQGIQAPNLDPEILLQLFQQGNIHLGLLVPEPDHIALGGGLAYHFNGQQDNGGKPGLLAPGIFIPLQQAQGQVQGIGAVFLQIQLGCAIQLLYGFGALRLRIAGPQTLVLEFRGNDPRQAPQLVKILHGEAVRGSMPVLGTGQNGKIAAVGQGVLQFIQG